MLLSLMRRHAKSWLIKFLIAIIAVVFIFYFGYSFTSDRGMKIAYVNGELISGVEYQKAYRSLLEAPQKDYKSVWSDNLIKVFNLKRKALQNLINEKLISQEARKIGLDITEEEIKDRIMAYPAFQFKGRFDETRYRSLLYHNRMKPEDFEVGIAQELLQEKIEQFLISLLPVTDQEILDYYTFSNEKVKISFVQFFPDDFKESVQLDQAAMEKYFNEHREDYRVPQKIKIAYILFDPDEFREKVTATDQQISDYYEDNIEMFKQEKQVNARHILFKVDQDAPDEEAGKIREKALLVLQKARQGEDFEGLAREYSEGPSGKEGGSLGYFSQGQMVKPFEEAVFKMKKGEISDLVRTAFGFHIIQVEDIKEARTKGLEEVREQIAEALINNVSMDLAHERALSLIDQMPYEADLSQYAAEHNVQIILSDYFSQKEPIPDIEGDEKLRKSIFSYEKNDVSDLIEFDGKFYIIQVVDKKASYLPELEEVSDKLKDDFTSYLSTIEAKSAAEKYLEKLKEGKTWDDLVKENDLTPETTDFFTRTGTIPQIGYDPVLQEAVFSLDENKRYPDQVFENSRGVSVIRWDGQKGIDQQEYREEKEKYRYSLMLAKHRVIFQDWLENLQEEAEIEIVTPVDSE